MTTPTPLGPLTIHRAEPRRVIGTCRGEAVCYALTAVGWRLASGRIGRLGGPLVVDPSLIAVLDAGSAAAAAATSRP